MVDGLLLQGTGEVILLNERRIGSPAERWDSDNTKAWTVSMQVAENPN